MKYEYLGFQVSQGQARGLSCWKQGVSGSGGLLVSLSVPRQALGRQEALVFSPDRRHCSLELLGPHCFCEEQQSLAVEFEVDTGVAAEVEVAAALSLQCQTPDGVSRWLCHSGRLPAAWCWAAQSALALHWPRSGLRSPRAPCRGSWVVV